MSVLTWLLLPSAAAVRVQVVQELTPGSAMAASHSGVALPEVGAEPASTTTSRLPVPPRTASMAADIEPGMILPSPFMVKAGPCHDVRLTSEPLPERTRVVAACALLVEVSVAASVSSATAVEVSEACLIRVPMASPRGGGGVGYPREAGRGDALSGAWGGAPSCRCSSGTYKPVRMGGRCRARIASLLRCVGGFVSSSVSSKGSRGRQGARYLNVTSDTSSHQSHASVIFGL